MKSLQIYSIDKLEVNSASARELHLFLETTSNFAEWISRRISQYEFTENQDYTIELVYTKGRPKKEYYITLDMAKELCMVENNEKGKQARQYFIKCEKELQKLKFDKYINEISALKAHQILQSKRVTNQINGYKSQIAQHNKQIAILKADLQKIDNTKAILQNVKDERDYFRKKYYEAYKTLGKDKDIVLSLHKIQKHLEPVYTALGAVMAYVDSNNTYFMKNNEIFKT